MYERDKKFEDRRQGYGMTLSSSENGPLAKLGILDACLESDCASYCHWVFAPSVSTILSSAVMYFQTTHVHRLPQGEVIGYYGRAFKDNTLPHRSQCDEKSIDSNHRKRGGGNLRVPREYLRQLLLNELQPGTVQWGKKFKDCQANPCALSTAGSNALQVLFDDGTSVTTDLLVGADGLKSNVRLCRQRSWENSQQHIQSTTISTKPLDIPVNGTNSRVKKVNDRAPLEYLGVSVIIGLSSCTHPLLVEQGFYVVDGTNRLFTMPFSVPTPGDPNSKRLCMWQLSFSGLSEGKCLAVHTLE